MEIEPRLWAVLLIGPPGAGKDTQAALLALELGLVQIKTSQIIDRKFSQAGPDDAAIQEQIRRKAAGDLVEPKLVLEWFIEELRSLRGQGKGIVASGSPRTLPEAEAELPVLEELYGKENVKIVSLQIGEEESVKRNSARRVCKQNNHPIPNFPEYEGMTACPQDGSPIITRADDTPETIRHRYQAYQEETHPVLDFFGQKGYAVATVHGEQPIENVHREILNKLW
ncbi:MAG TPA: nucleoside monophosphate kinase [Candidatus Paceibacterota bacterium]|nr:nucleoside monophosphate kinase [Candidatus Paceibacterota bacterium]